MNISDECGSGPYDALVLVDGSHLVDVPMMLFAHLEEPPQSGVLVTYEGVSVRLEERRPASDAAAAEFGVEWVWIGRMCPT